MSEESATLPSPSSIPSSIQPKQRINPHDIRNVDLVQRFLAATPSYLYSPPPLGPPNFFFSEMLRSLVQNKANENARALSNQLRRPRKRLWTPPIRHDSSNELPTKEPMPNEKPLELTTKQHQLLPTAFNPMMAKSPKLESNEKSNSNENAVQKSSSKIEDFKMPSSYSSNGENSHVNEPSTASLPPSDLVMPQIPPMWYPPLYPPYGIDPLHFFIDLRVSGQIYDRKKENGSPSADNKNENNNQIGLNRHGSAFSVPTKYDKNSTAAAAAAAAALNLSSTTLPRPNCMDFANNNHYGDTDDKSRNTNYVLQNLPRIYTNLSSPQNVTSAEDRNSFQSEESESNKSGSEIDVKDHDQMSNHSDDVVIVDGHCGDGQHEKRLTKRK